MKDIILVLLIIFFALNMGASGVVPSFAAAYGAKLIKKTRIILLFTVFVVIGAVLLGHNVSMTLGKSLIPKEYINRDVVLVIIFSATLSLFLANIMKIPQSTSQVTVGAISGAGLYFGKLYSKALFLKIIPMWIILPLLSFIFTYLLYRLIYPPRHGNLHVYERLFLHEKRVRTAAILVSCYVAFAIGSNNVANAVGPLSGAGIIGIASGLLAISPLFGLGALLLGKGTLETAGKEIVPLGVFSSILVAFVTATLLLVASLFSVPQSLVQLNVCAIFAISFLKNGHRNTLGHYVTRKTFVIWALTPLISVFISYFSLVLFSVQIHK